jgi:hypothetical protein
MKFAGVSGCGEVLWLLSYGEEVEGRTSSLLGRNVVLCVKNRVWANTVSRFGDLFPHLSTAYEQIRALQTRVVTEQTVFLSIYVSGYCKWWGDKGFEL